MEKKSRNAERESLRRVNSFFMGGVLSCVYLFFLQKVRIILLGFAGLGVMDAYVVMIGIFPFFFDGFDDVEQGLIVEDLASAPVGVVITEKENQHSNECAK